MENNELVLFGRHLFGEQLHAAFVHEHVNVTLFNETTKISLLQCKKPPIIVWGTNHRQVLRDSLILKNKGFKVYRYWIGGDVLGLTKMLKSKKLINTLLNKFIFKRHFANSDWLTEELNMSGLKSMPIPFSPLCCPDHHPLTEFPPKPLRIIFYSIEGCDHIYQPNIMKQCADILPEVEFICCGNNKLSVYGNNIINIGLIENSKMCDIYSSSHCLFRFTSHDGFARSILEALSYGLYVITNQPIPFTEQIDNVQSAVAAIRRIEGLNLRNHQARKWAFENYSSKTFVNNIMRLVN